jgi:glucose/mannose transport system permease protein
MPVKPLPAGAAPLSADVPRAAPATNHAPPRRLASFYLSCRAFLVQKLKNTDNLIAIALIAPSIIAVGVFIYGFIAWTLRVSLSSWKGLLPDYTWVGLKNYTELFADPRFLIDLRNTAIFTFVFVLGALLLGFFTALLLDQNLPGESFFRNLFLFPLAISYIVTGVIWRWLMNPAGEARISGFNQIFASLGWDSLINRWHTTPNWGIAAIALAAIWQMSGFTMALYLGGFRSISDQVREAARVDGASEWQLYRYIIIPMLNPVTLSAVIILGHISLKVFDLIIALAGKQLALDVPAIYMWQATFDGYFFSRGAAISILLLLIISILIIPYIYYNLKNEADV